MPGMTTDLAISVRPNLLAAWLRSNLNVTDTMVSGTTPNTLFGLIPVGREDISQPLNRVSRVAVSTKLSPAGLLVGLILVVLALAASGGGSIVLWLLAAVALATSYRTELLITDNGGGTQEVAVSPLDKTAVQSFAAAINQKLATQ